MLNPRERRLFKATGLTDGSTPAYSMPAPTIVVRRPSRRKLRASVVTVGMAVHSLR